LHNFADKITVIFRSPTSSQSAHRVQRWS